MPSRQVSVVAVVAFCVACGGVVFKEPAPGSFQIVHAQMKSEGGLSSIQGATVTHEFFQSAGIQPLVGRFFIEGDERASPPRVVVLSYVMWTEHFASSPATVGRTIELGGQTLTVVGIAPHGFNFPEDAQFWMPSSH